MRMFFVTLVDLEAHTKLHKHNIEVVQCSVRQWLFIAAVDLINHCNELNLRLSFSIS